MVGLGDTSFIFPGAMLARGKVVAPWRTACRADIRVGGHRPKPRKGLKVNDTCTRSTPANALRPTVGVNFTLVGPAYGRYSLPDLGEGLKASILRIGWKRGPEADIRHCSCAHCVGSFRRSNGDCRTTCKSAAGFTYSVSSNAAGAQR